METKLFLVYPGEIESAIDGDIHKVGAKDLMRLYGVDPKDCIVVNNGYETKGLRGKFYHLRPRFKGDYDLATCPQVEHR